MGLEQRGRVRRLHERNNWKQDDLDACDKQTVPYRETMGIRSVSSDQIQRKGGRGGWADARAVRGRLVEKSLQALESVVPRTSKEGAELEMEVGPLRSAYRGGLQTAGCC